MVELYFIDLLILKNLLRKLIYCEDRWLALKEPEKRKKQNGLIIRWNINFIVNWINIVVNVHIPVFEFGF